MNGFPPLRHIAGVIGLAFCLPVTSLPAQSRFPIHPHVAEIHNSGFEAEPNGRVPIPVDPGQFPLDPGTDRIRSSVLFNVPDGIWNHGEGFRLTPDGPAADTGGYHEFDTGEHLKPSDIHVQVPTGTTTPWHTWSTTDLGGNTKSVRRLVGYLHPEPEPGTDGFAAKNAFEILVPESFVPGNATVLVVGTFPTLPPADDAAWPVAYPGHAEHRHQQPWNAGLIGAGRSPVEPLRFTDVYRPLPLDRVVAMSATPEASGINIVGAHIVPPHNGPHLVLGMQRVLQLLRAIEIAFDDDPTTVTAMDPPSEWQVPTMPFPVVAMGGSNGGQMAQMLAGHFPNRVHGAVSVQFPTSMRQGVGQQEMCALLTASQGFDGTSQRWGETLALPFATYYQRLGYDFETGSLLALWRAGTLRRPILLLGGDEDTVWFGEDSLPEIVQMHNHHPNGATGTLAQGGRVFWSIQNRTCHDPRAPISLPAELLAGSTLSATQTEYWPCVLALLDDAVVSWVTEPLPGDLPPTAAPMQPPSSGTMIQPENDPYDHVLARGTIAERRVAVAASAAAQSTVPLFEDTAFRDKQRGFGTWTGMARSLDCDSAGRVYVGSADGVVSRLVLKTSLGIPAEGPDPYPDLTDVSFVLDARCIPSGGSPDAASHGYGVFGLDVSDDDAYVAFGTHRRLWVYATSDLGAPYATCDLLWDEQRPRRIQIVDNFFGNDSSSRHLVSLSFSGELSVRRISSGSCELLASYSAPSLVDFVVGPALPLQDYGREVYVSGLHNHVFRLVFSKDPVDPNATPPVQAAVKMIGASDEIGMASNLQWVSSSLPFGGNGLVGFVPRRVGGGNGVHFFGSAQRALSVAGVVPLSHGGTNNQLGALGARTGDFTNFPGDVAAIPDLDMYAVAYGGQLYLVPGNSVNSVLLGWDPDSGTPPPLQSTLYKTFRFPGAMYPTSIDTTDLDGDAIPDLVMATQNGQVSWIPAVDLIAAMETAGNPDLANGDLLLHEIAALGGEWFGPESGAPPAAPSVFSTGSVVATWGMTPSDGAGPALLEVVDQCGRRWGIERATGTVRYRHLVQTVADNGFVSIGTPLNKPFRDLVHVKTDPPMVEVPGVHRTVDVGPEIYAPGNITDRYELETWFDLAVRPGWLEDGIAFAVQPDSGAVDYVRMRHSQVYAEQYLPFAFGGDLLRDGDRRDAYYWSGSPGGAPANPLIQGQQGSGVVRGLRHDLATGDFSVWGSSTNLASETSGPNPQSNQVPLRNATYGFAPFDAQSLRVGKWGDDVRIVLGTAGGGLTLLDPGQESGEGSVLSFKEPPESGDHGFGGIALAVSPLRANDPTVFFGTLNTHGGGFAGAQWGHDLVSSLHVYGYADGELVAGQQVVFDGSGTKPKLFGLCGIATGDLFVDDTDDVPEELVLTTLNGDLVVYGLVPSGAAGGVALTDQPLHWSVHDGAVGASNSIFVDEQATPRAVFVAGSMGMRKFTVQ